MGPFPEPKVSMTTPFSGGWRKVRTWAGSTDLGGFRWQEQQGLSYRLLNYLTSLSW